MAPMTREPTSRLLGRETQLRNAHDGSRPTIRRARPTSFAGACAPPARSRGSLLEHGAIDALRLAAVPVSAKSPSSVVGSTHTRVLVGVAPNAARKIHRGP